MSLSQHSMYTVEYTDFIWAGFVECGVHINPAPANIHAPSTRGIAVSQVEHT